LKSSEQSPLSNNFVFEKENKRNDISSIFSISGSIHSMTNQKINRDLSESSEGSQKGYSGKKISESNTGSQKVYAGKRINHHNESKGGDSFIDITKSNLFVNVFNTSPLKTSSVVNLSSPNKNNAKENNSNVIVSNRSTKQKEITNLFETSKKESKKKSNDDDLDLLELMDG